MDVMEKTGSATEAVSDVYEAYKGEEAKKVALRKRISEVEATYKAALAEYTEASGLDDEEWKAKASGEMKTLKQDIERMKAELEAAETNPLRTLADVREEGKRQDAALRERMAELEAEIARRKAAFLEALGQLGETWRDLYGFYSLLHSVTGEKYFPGNAPDWDAYFIDEKEYSATYGVRPGSLSYKTN